jgi:hypothetical protein
LVFFGFFCVVICVCVWMISRAFSNFKSSNNRNRVFKSFVSSHQLFVSCLKTKEQLEIAIQN